ncbi:hypothetical protein G5V57_16665 [Nordella sp. HKS 07]|uniref:vWA domain-containing protein n=1 Tax=Nordella sp. HKS 07 TaxID=2712222 RepID=UPI0013E142FC|nr:VWA domain-containing protein [Nordella sp. HKS 07]QIG49205.1 hypothetical protein G5V57_16665 [Nordella sp. HKS 07]
MTGIPPSRNSAGWLRRFAGDARGNVALFTALAALPLLVAAGVAIDVARASRSQTALQVAVDAAALAVASSGKSDLAGLSEAQKKARQQEMKDMAERFLRTNYAYGGQDLSVQINVTDEIVSVEATQPYPTTLMKLVGYQTMDLGAHAEVNLQGGIAENIEIVLVMDITGSMKGSKIESAKAAAKALIQKVLGDKESDDKVRFALVPFAGSVNVGGDKVSSGWIDTTGKAAVSKVNFTNATYHNMKGWDDLRYRNAAGQTVKLPWNGCVEARLGAYATNDTEPSASSSDTLFTPYFAPDEPDANVNDDYGNNYLSDGVTGNETARLKNQAKYANKVVSISFKTGPGANCASSPIIPLTPDRSVIEKGIDDMKAEGPTNLVEGIMWGWRVVSPGLPFTEGKSFQDKEWRKIVVLMTDGENDVGTNSSRSMPPAATGTIYTAFGYSKVDLAKNRFGTQTQSLVRGKLDAAFETACTNLKAKHEMRESQGRQLPSLELYTIGFMVKSELVEALTKCASDPSLNGNQYQYYINAANETQLKGAFETIGARLKTMYLSK